MFKAIAAACMVAVTVCVCILILQVRDVVAKVPKQITQTRSQLMDRLESLQSASLKEIDRQASNLALDLDGQVSGLRSQLDSQLSGIRGDALTAVKTAVEPIAGLRSDLSPALVHIGSITAHFDDASRLAPELTRNALGAVAAFKVTSGELTKTAIDFRRATPGILDMVKKVGDNSDLATTEAIGTAKESRRLVKNLADNTAPLPKWIRYPAQVVGLVGSAAVPVLTLQKLSTVK